MESFKGMQQSKRMVLIIDDSYLIIERLTDMLKESECVGEVMHALSGTTALEVLQARTPDIALLDINLPDISGIELLRIIKERYPCIIVIMLTNQANDYYRQLCLNLGARHFADKSKDFESIPGLIAALEE
jgi:DNA-binding NarL/FixJ family response regulator